MVDDLGINLTPSRSDASPSDKEHVLNVIQLNEIGLTHIKSTYISLNDIYIKLK
jgi:hypothetical protein